MAEYYGACTGKVGDKYNVWLAVIQNYQSVEGNFSNISVGLYLKRNDGVSNSAYNLNDWENQALIQVNGESKTWRNLDIDTRDNVTVVLAEWTGDVYHNADGTLTVNIDGSFVMGNSNVTGGQAYGSFTCTTIPRKSQMSFSSTDLYPGNNLTCYVASASAEFSHSINFYLEQTEGSIWLAEGVTSGDFYVPYEWAYQLPWSTSANVTVVLTTYCYGQFIGSEAYTVRFIIPDTYDFKPTFELVVEQVDDGKPREWGIYVKGISGVKVDATNLNLKYGAVVVACEARVGGTVYNSIPSWFYLLDSGNVEISLSIRDSRGFTYSASTWVYVNNYYAPSLTINSIRRCDAYGTVSESGAYLLVDYSTSFCSYDGKNEMGVMYSFGQSSGGWSEERLLNGSPAIIGDGFITPTSSYSLRFRIYDWITWRGVITDRSVPSADVPFNIRRGGKGAAFGCYAEADNQLTIGWDLDIRGKIKGTDMQLLPSDNISYTTDFSRIRHYPSINTCFINIGVISSVDIPANSDFIVGYTQIKPIDFSPLSAMALPFNGCQAWVDLATNAIVFRSGEVVTAGTGIYINGLYTTN